MDEIAQEAGLSRYTVSKILNGDTTVKAASRDAVMAICKRHGYMPNNNAVGLVKGRTNIVAMIVPYITDDFYNEMIELTETLIESKGYRLIYKSSYNDATKEAEIIQSFLALKVSALIIVPVVDGPNVRIHTLAAKHVPVIYIDRTLNKRGYSVLNDNEASAAAMTEHLLGTTERVAYLGSFYGDSNPTSLARKNGYISTMEEHALRPDIIACDASTEKQDNERFGYENMAHYLRNGGRADAVFCVTDAVALGAIKAVRDSGKVPGRDIRIAGHDNLRFTEFVYPSITTMKQPIDLMCRASVAMADDLIHDRFHGKKQQIFTSELIIRESA
ncbi:MAG: LacI family DNA-binding transcriptional regulator [Spirochaetota bacterium]